MRSGEALFVVDDAAERAMREATSRGREGVRTTLAKMGDAISVVTWLDTEPNVRRPTMWESKCRWIFWLSDFFVPNFFVAIV
jgi:hypothetical protein